MSGWYRPVLCDEEGVPLLVQEMHYRSGKMVWEARFFNGLERTFLTEHVSPSMGLMQHAPTPMQWYEAWYHIEQHVLKNYRWLFPTAEVRKL